MQRLRAAAGELQDELDALEKRLAGDEEAVRAERRFATPVTTLMRLAGAARRHGKNPAEVLARAEEVLGPLGESYRVYWAGMGAFLWYVLALFGMLFLVLAVFSIFVYPQLSTIFDQGGAALPALTVVTIKSLGVFLDLGFFLMAAGVVALAIAAHRIKEAMKRLEPLHGFVLRIPGLGPLVAAYNQTLSFNLSQLLVRAGLSAEQALGEVSRLWPAAALRQDQGDEGALAGLLRTDPLGGTLLLAQRAGTLDAELEHLSAAAHAVFAGQLARVREEFTLVAQVLVGVVIAIMVVGMYLPIFKMGEMV